MREAGNHGTRVVEVPDRNHLTLMTSLNAEDDRIRALVLDFIGGHH